MSTKNETQETKKKSGHKMQALSEDMLENVAGGINEQQALRKWQEFGLQSGGTGKSPFDSQSKTF